jgi:hypothetical protein
MSKAKFKAGQVVRFPSSNKVGTSARKGGTILGIKPMYELKEENKRYYPNGKCKGDLTTFVGLSNGVSKGYAYEIVTIQPEGFRGEKLTVEEFKLNLSTEEKVLAAYIG